MTPSAREAELARLCDGLCDPGWATSTTLLDEPTIDALALECDQAFAAGRFHPAAVGRAAARAERASIRSDHVLWVERDGAGPATTAYLDAMDQLRLGLNRSLFLGLEELEAHFAVYPPGARYDKHLDRFRDDDARVVSVVLYLNRAWPRAAGGQLRLFVEPGSEQGPTRDLLPEAGTLVLFLSDRFWHEVLPATLPRRSITGWFRRRPR